jgi:VWFA-related protein
MAGSHRRRIVRQCVVLTALLSAALAWSPSAASKAQTQTQAPVFRSGINLRQIDVSVLDKDRRPVHGLTAADFTLLEDGKPQEIAGFVEITVPDPEDLAAAWTRRVSTDVRSNEAEEGRLLVIVLDDAMIQFEQASAMVAVTKICEGIIDRMGPEDLAAIVFTMDFRASQDFTNDRDRLRRAVRGFKPKRYGDSDMMSRQSVSTVSNVANYLADIPRRRKALVYVSTGPYGFRMNQKPNALSGGGAAVGTRAETGGESSSMGLGAAAAINLDRALQALERAQQANVSVYSLNPLALARSDADLQQLRADAPTANPGNLSFYQPNTGLDFLQFFSSASGGFSVSNPGEFSAGLTQMFRETGSYYLLGYQSNNPVGKSKFKAFDVHVNQPDLLVRSRAGYVVAKPTAADAGVDTARGAMAGILPVSDISLTATAVSFAVRGKDPTVAVTVAVRQPAPAGASAVAEDVELLVAAFGPLGERHGTKVQTARFMLTPKAGGDVRYQMTSRVDLSPGRYELRMSMRSQTRGKNGSVYIDVDVPNFNKDAVSLSGLVLGTRPPLPSAPKDGLVGLTPLVPTTRREFSPTDAVSGFVRVYQGGSSPLAPVPLAVRLVNERDDAIVAKKPSLAVDQFSVDRAADYRLDLPLQRLAPGSYLLSIGASIGKMTATREVRFRVQ